MLYLRIDSIASVTFYIKFITSMKKHIILSFFVLGVYTLLFGQDYVAYHKAIMNAESKILDSNYSESLAIYDSIFKLYDFVYARHCYTAIQLATREKKEDLVFFFLEKGIKQGLTVDIIENAPIINELSKSNKWKEFKVKKYDSLRKTYLNNINIQLRDEIERLSAIDQYFTNKVNESTLLSYIIKNNKWKRVVEMLVETKLIEIIKQYGFPGEKIIGIEEVNLSYINFSKEEEKELNTMGKRTFTPFSAQYILIHYFSIPHPNFNTLLKQEIKKGNIEPSQYASICDFQAKYGKKYKNEGYYNQWHRDTNMENRNDINKRRLNIGLETFEEYRKKEKRNYKIRKEIEKGNYDHVKIYTVFGGY